MNIRTLSMALLFTGMALLAERLPMPDAHRLERAADAWAADAGLGIQTLGWEAGHAWDRVDAGWADLGRTGLGLDRPSDAALLGAAGALLLGLLGLAAVRTRSARAPGVRGARPAARARTSGRLPARNTPRPSVDRRLARARSLAAKGGASLDVARRTTLSRDAVELLTRIHAPDGISGGGRSFRGALA